MTAVEYVFSLFAQCFSSVFGWFFQILAGADALGLYLALFAMYMVVRFLIVPIIGNSDSKEVGDD